MKAAKVIGKSRGIREFKEAEVRIPTLRNVDLITEPRNSYMRLYQKVLQHC